MKKSKWYYGIFLIALLFVPLESYAYYPVFDATNNLLATLQKSMDSAFQTVQKANMATLIQQGKQDYAEQIKIYEECVRQYEECVKIYQQAQETYNWIDRNIGNARNLRTFLSNGFSNTGNLQQMQSLLNTTLHQSSSATNEDYNSILLHEVDSMIGSDLHESYAGDGLEMQNYGQAGEKLADKSDELSRMMLEKLRTKDQVLENKVNTGSADLLQIVHANEQVSVFIAEELARMNTNLSTLNRSYAKQLEDIGEIKMNQAQEAAMYDRLEREALKRSTDYIRQQNSWNRINHIFQNCRRF